MRPKTATGFETGSRPKTLTVPASARHKPRMCLIKVDFPAPFSPTSPNTLPRGTCSERLFNAVFEPNLRDKFVMETTDSAKDGSCIRLPSRLLARPPACEVVLHQSANLIFIQIQ